MKYRIKQISASITRNAAIDNAEIFGLESIWQHLGGFGKFQILYMACVSCTSILSAFATQGYILTASPIKHRCLIPECESENASYGSEEDLPWLPSAIPTDASGRYDSCLRYHLNHSAADGDRICSNATFSSHTYKCDRFVYDTDEWTIQRENWGISCDEDLPRLKLIGFLNNVGQAGSFLSGYLQDRFGRKRVLVTMSLTIVISALIKSISVSYIMMIIFEVLEGFAAFSLLSIPTIFVVEILEPAQRVLMGSLLSITVSIGSIAFGVVQYLTYNWRSTLQICYGPFLLVASFYWVLPEPVIWLIGHKKYEEAIVELQKIAKINGVDYPEAAVNVAIGAEQEKLGVDRRPWEDFKQVIGSSVIRQRTAASLLAGMSSIFVHSAIPVLVGAVSKDKFINFMLAGFVDVPGRVSGLLFARRFGRKPCVSIFMLFSGVVCALAAFLPTKWNYLQLALMIISKSFMAGAWYILSIGIIEMNPTFMRSSVLSAVEFIGLTVSLAAPLLPNLNMWYTSLPLLTLSLVAVLGASAVAAVPETIRKTLPNTVKQAENL